MKRRWIALLIVVLLGVVCALGPRPSVEAPDATLIANQIPQELSALDAFLQEKESKTPNLRPGTEKKIFWFDGVRRTKLSLVYVHGFSASRQETSPLSEDIAKRLQANLFLTRLRGHGQSGEDLAKTSAKDWLEDTLEAFTIGQRLGEKVVLIGTSTGATLALWLAMQPPAQRQSLAALVLLSPNVGPKAAEASLLTLPWAKVILPLFIPTRSWTPKNEEQAKYWTCSYPLGALFPMQALVEFVQKRPPEALTTPSLFVYNPNDEVIDGAKIDVFYEKLQGPKEKFLVRPSAKDDSHVIAGKIMSPDQTAILEEEIVRFLRGLGL